MSVIDMIPVILCGIHVDGLNHYTISGTAITAAFAPCEPKNWCIPHPCGPKRSTSKVALWPPTFAELPDYTILRNIVEASKRYVIRRVWA